MHWPRRLLLFAAAATFATAALLVMAVIPPVRADTFPQATPERAVPAFWLSAILNMLVAAAAFDSSRLRSGRAARRRVSGGLAGLVALLLAVALMDAAAALAAHGPAMRGAVVALWLCVCLDLSGGVFMIVSAFMQRAGSPGQPQVPPA